MRGWVGAEMICFRLLNKCCLVLMKHYAIHIIQSNRIRAPVLKLVHNECSAELEIGLASSWVNTQYVSVHPPVSQSLPVSAGLDPVDFKTPQSSIRVQPVGWKPFKYSQFSTSYITTHWCFIFKEEIYFGHGIPQHTVWTEVTYVQTFSKERERGI